MTARAQRLAPVRRLVDTTERRLAQSLAGLERQLLAADEKLRELTRYRGEYEQQFAARAAGGMSVPELRDYQAFLARLTEAIRQQHSVVQRVRSDRDAERLRWQHAAQRAKAVEHVATQWQLEEQHAAERREQQQIDERAQRISRREP